MQPSEDEKKCIILGIINVYAKTGATLKNIRDDYKSEVGAEFATTRNEGLDFLVNIEGVYVDSNGLYRSKSKNSKHINKLVLEQKVPEKFRNHYNNRSSKFKQNNTANRSVTSYASDYAEFTVRPANGVQMPNKIQRRRNTLGEGLLPKYSESPEPAKKRRRSATPESDERASRSKRNRSPFRDPRKRSISPRYSPRRDNRRPSTDRYLRSPDLKRRSRSPRRHSYARSPQRSAYARSPQQNSHPRISRQDSYARSPHRISRANSPILEPLSPLTSSNEPSPQNLYGRNSSRDRYGRSTSRDKLPRFRRKSCNQNWDRNSRSPSRERRSRSHIRDARIRSPVIDKQQDKRPSTSRPSTSGQKTLSPPIQNRATTTKWDTSNPTPQINPQNPQMKPHVKPQINLQMNPQMNPKLNPQFKGVRMADGAAKPLGNTISSPGDVSGQSRMKKFRFTIIGDGFIYYMMTDMQLQAKSQLPLCSHNLTMPEAYKRITMQQEILKRKRRKVLISIGASDLRNGKNFRDIKKEFTELFLLCEGMGLKPLITTILCFDNPLLKKRSDDFNHFLKNTFDNVVNINDVLRCGLAEVMTSMNRTNAAKLNKENLSIGLRQQLVLNLE